MTQEDEKLLLKDLCARLPYGVKISIPDLWAHDRYIEILDEIFKGDDGLYRVNSKGQLIEHIKPYLFPLSSITEEQWEELMFISETRMTFTPDRVIAAYKYTIEWFLKNHIDYNNLIGKGLAIDATNLNIY